MRVLPARTELFLIGLIGLLLRFCPRNGGADAIGKGGARRKDGIRRKLGDIRLQKHDLLRPVRDFAQAKRQGQVDGITQGLNIFPQGAGGAAAPSSSTFLPRKDTIMPTLTVKGMSCNHCKQAVTQALEALPGVSDVNVDLEKGEATWKESQPLDIAEVKKAINKLGFEA